VIPVPFEYVAPASVEEALSLLTEHGDEAKILAGGHSLLPLMKLRLAAPAVLVDLGTGTGSVARLVAERFTDAEVVGVDISERMIDEARTKTDGDRVRYVVADAQHLPFEDGAFDLVTLANMIPFFDELARVVATGGWVLFAFSVGPDTPIYVTPERLRAELGRRGFADFAEHSAGRGTSLIARKN